MKKMTTKSPARKSKPASKIIKPHMLLILRVFEHPCSIYSIQLPVKIVLVSHKITQYNKIINENLTNASTRLLQQLVSKSVCFEKPIIIDIQEREEDVQASTTNTVE